MRELKTLLRTIFSEKAKERLYDATARWAPAALGAYVLCPPLTLLFVAAATEEIISGLQKDYKEAKERAAKERDANEEKVPMFASIFSPALA